MQLRLRLNRPNYELLSTILREEAQKAHQAVVAQVGREINVGSSQQLGRLLFDELRFPRKGNRKTGKVTTDENALRELRVERPAHKELLNAIIAEKHIRKKIESYIEVEFDEDGYIPFSANPAGTETNRWAFSKSPTGRGLNVQTLPKSMRIMCDAPSGSAFICPDLPQADARIVAWDAKCESLIRLFDDPTRHYHLENCLRLFRLPREEVYAPAFKDDPRYVLGKAMGHAANYRMAPKRLAVELGISVAEATRLLGVYLHQLYPEIERWQYAIKERIQREGGLRTPKPFERWRVFYKAWAEMLLTGKLSNGSWNEGCAHIPQSTVADIVNVGMEALWRDVKDVRFHLHHHDSFLASVPGDRLGVVCEAALEGLRVTLTIHDRPLLMEPEMQVGTNYGQMVVWKGERTLGELEGRLKVKMAIDEGKLRKELYGYY